MKCKSALILSLTAVFLAVSCDRKGLDSVTSEKSAIQNAEVVKSDKTYHLKEMPLPQKSGDVLSAAPLNSGKYMVAFRSIENVVPGFYTANADFSEYTLCDTGIEFRENAEISVRFACAADGTLYAAVTEITHGGIPPYNYLAPEQNADDFDRDTYESNSEYYHFVYRFSDNGEAVSKTEITGIDDYEISDLTVCGGKFYLYCGGMMYTADETSGQAEEYQLSDGVAGGIGVTSGDELVCGVYDGNDTGLMAGDKMFSVSYSGEPVSHIFSGGNEFDFVFAGKTGIYGLSGDTLTEIAVNVNLGIDEGAAADIFPTEKGYILRIFNRISMCHSLYLLTDIPEEDAPQEPVTLKLGVLYQTEDFSSHVASFNRSGKNIIIEPVYYSEYDVYDKGKKEYVSRGTDRFAMDIISGDAPDLAVFMNTSFDLKGKGAFVDMYGLMDEELSRDMFMPNVLEACEYEGKLYSLPTSFTVRSMAVKTKFSGVENQTFDDMLAVVENAPAGIAVQSCASKTNVLTDYLSYSDYAVSCKDGKFSVNTGNMEKLLEFCNRFPERESGEWYDAGRDEVLFSEFAAERFSDFRTFYDMLAEPVTFAGYPSENAEGGVISMSCNVAVMEKCSDKDAAWEFVKSMYIGDNSGLAMGINMGLPILNEDFQQLAEMAESSGSFTDEELEQAIGVIKNAVRPAGVLPNDLYVIILEEAQPYFAGECTAEEAASYIRNRTDIYISENE